MNPRRGALGRVLLLALVWPPLGCADARPAGGQAVDAAAVSDGPGSADVVSPQGVKDGAQTPGDLGAPDAPSGDGPAIPDAPVTADGRPDLPAGCQLGGAFCGSDQSCCSGRCRDGVCGGALCKPELDLCAGHGDCCSGTCYQGKCVAFCQPEGYTCSNNLQCCNYACNSGYCGPPLITKCMGDGFGPCAKDGDCCSQTCRDGSCQPRRLCRPPGEACAGAVWDCCAPARCVDRVCEIMLKAEMGDPCVSDRQCTTGKCVGGVCARVCGLAGGRCHVPSDPCCGGNCGPPNTLNQMCGAPTTCFPLYAPCASPADCCSKVCDGGLCKHAGQCTKNGEACVGNDECCGGLCARGYDGPVKCVACLAVGYKCARPSDCCGGSCVDGVCKGGPGACRLHSSGCTFAGECCSNRCEPNGVEQFKVCVEP